MTGYDGRMMRNKCWAVAAVLAVPAAASASVPAAALDAGVAAYQAGDFLAARTYLRPLADRGSAIAETMLGVMAARGEGGKADPAVAAGWWLRAANRGYAPAQLALAKALAKGQGVAADPGQAWLWARLAASAGNGVSDEARALAASLATGFDAAQLAALEAERAAWRPWPPS
jgi:TPR repeat protein